MTGNDGHRHVYAYQPLSCTPYVRDLFTTKPKNLSWVLRDWQIHDVQRDDFGRSGETIASILYVLLPSIKML